MTPRQLAKARRSGALSTTHVTWIGQRCMHNVGQDTSRGCVSANLLGCSLIINSHTMGVFLARRANKSPAARCTNDRSNAALA